MSTNPNAQLALTFFILHCKYSATRNMCLFFCCYRLLQSLIKRHMLKCHFTSSSQPLLSSLCSAGGTVTPWGRRSLIDEAHMWAPYASWQGQRSAVTSEPGGLWTGTRQRRSPTAAKIHEQGQIAPKLHHHGDARQKRAQLDGQTHIEMCTQTHTHSE